MLRPRRPLDGARHQRRAVYAPTALRDRVNDHEVQQDTQTLQPPAMSGPIITGANYLSGDTHTQEGPKGNLT